MIPAGNVVELRLAAALTVTCASRVPDVVYPISIVSGFVLRLVSASAVYAQRRVMGSVAARVALGVGERRVKEGDCETVE
ncbi:hypothetical protein BJY01DRAFT_228927 [Aspergillus pseudoustus]|uniref:Secreted protein n=1 Tax=Aspergillus pseudoustus TaxID=1810923 RepID=A0ABR4IJA7_9EURO